MGKKQSCMSMEVTIIQNLHSPSFTEVREAEARTRALRKRARSWTRRLPPNGAFGPAGPHDCRPLALCTQLFLGLLGVGRCLGGGLGAPGHAWTSWLCLGSCEAQAHLYLGAALPSRKWGPRLRLDDRVGGSTGARGQRKTDPCRFLTQRGRRSHNLQCRGEFSLSATPVTFPDGVMSTWFFRLWNPAVQTPVRERSTSCGLDQLSPPLPPASLPPLWPPTVRPTSVPVRPTSRAVTTESYVCLPRLCLPPRRSQELGK